MIKPIAPEEVLGGGLLEDKIIEIVNSLILSKFRFGVARVPSYEIKYLIDNNGLTMPVNIVEKITTAYEQAGWKVSICYLSGAAYLKFEPIPLS
jgi:hypothetical protein